MRSSWFASLVLFTGCDAVFGLGDRGLDAGHDGAGDGGTVDTVPAEACMYSITSEEAFVDLAPLYDFAVDASGQGYVTGLANTELRTAAIAAMNDRWAWQRGGRDDGLANYLGARPDDADPNVMYAFEDIEDERHLGTYSYTAFGWSRLDQVAVGRTERLGNSIAIGGKRYFVITRDSTADGMREMVLRVRDGSVWSEESPMTAINQSQTPDLGVLTRDGRTLIYSARTQTGSYDLYLAQRASLDDPFDTGIHLDDLSTGADEVDPWISGSCETLYFRRGGSRFEAAPAATSEIWRARP